MNPLRPLHLSLFARGGAARAAERLVEAQHRAGADPLLVTEAGSESSAALLDHSPFYLRPFMRRSIQTAVNRHLSHLKRTGSLFSTSEGWHPIEHILPQFPADIIHLHWISCNFVPISTLPKLPQPLVWTLHDMWGFTGGCHYAGECRRYEQTCGACPVLQSTSEADEATRQQSQKRQQWRNLDLTIITPSRWLADCARRSAVLAGSRIEVIPNGVDQGIFRQRDPHQSRIDLGLNPDKQYVLFGAADLGDERKGLRELLAALPIVQQQIPDLELLIFGRSESSLNLRDIPVHALGSITDDTRLNQVYTAADLFISPSLEDNLPNTVMEALSSGTPSVAFGIGGLPDLIDHQQNGYLARPFEVDDLAAGMRWVLEHPQPEQLQAAARAKVEREFSLNVVARKTLDLYRELLQNDQRYL